jgi:hypothetical protein
MTVRIRSLSCISTATLLLLWNAAFSYPQTAPDTRIIPTLSVTPNLAAVGQASQVLFTVTNQNSASSMQLMTGDSLTLNFDLADGLIQTLPSAVMVTSSTLSATDFLVTQGANPSQLVILYNGAPANFGFEDSITINPVLQAPGTVRTNNITLQLPNQDRFTNGTQNFASWFSANFPFGTPGPQGPAGPPGPTGPVGSSVMGPQGPVGASGPAGPSGPPGPAGASLAGPQGPAGQQGPPGPTGPQGPSGVSIQGLQGPQGLQGSQGLQGLQGPPGMVFRNKWSATKVYIAADSVTYNGSSYISLIGTNVGNPPDVSQDQWFLLAAAGATGPLGPVGPAGTTGAVGPAGPIGLTGATGTTGPAGPIGLTGPAGATGPAGPIGLTGPAGATGPAGPIGPIGPSGPTGATGPAGPIGLNGLTGPQGPQGVPGPAGPSGANLAPVYRTTNFQVLPYQTTTGSASCPAGYILSGGYQISQAAASEMFVSQNMATSNTQWAVTVQSLNSVTAVVTITYFCTQ